MAGHIDDLGFPADPPRNWLAQVERVTVVSFAMACAAIVIWALLAAAQAHELYAGLRSPNGADCCDDRDCRPVPWRDVDGIIEYNLDGLWIRAAPHNLIHPIDDGAHACWPQRGGEGVNPDPRCLMPPGFGA